MDYLKPLMPFLAGWILLLFTASFFELAAINGAAQLLLFALVVCLPAYMTGRLSYVDIGWPLGLAVIGAVVLIVADGNLVRKLLVGGAYLFMGLRMGLGAIKLWRMGHLQKELPRYEYQRIRWQRKNIKNIPLIIQVEALVQGFANMSFLAIPAFIIASNQSAHLHWLEVLGMVIWLAAFAMETVADAQKHRFLQKVKSEGLKRQVCNVGLWRFSRHPNYFAEWMVWNALIVASIPSWLVLQSKEPLWLWGVLGLALLYVSRIMYVTLVHYTGAKPAEHFSVQKRPAYKEYQETTNIFFPGPSR